MSKIIDEFLNMGTKAGQLAWLEAHLRPRFQKKFTELYASVKEDLAEYCGPNTVMNCIPSHSIADLRTFEGTEYSGEVLDLEFWVDSGGRHSRNIIFVLDEHHCVIKLLATTSDTNHRELKMN